jgi:hypothetical protein
MVTMYRCDLNVEKFLCHVDIAHVISIGPGRYILVNKMKNLMAIHKQSSQYLYIAPSVLIFLECKQTSIAIVLQ